LFTRAVKLVICFLRFASAVLTDLASFATAADASSAAAVAASAASAAASAASVAALAASVASLAASIAAAPDELENERATF
jgi:hypothetical protein